MKKTVWMSFDLGIKGDYQGLYRWLDYHDAKECGESLAVFKFDSNSPTTSEIPDEIKASLKTSMQDDSNTRIYIIVQGRRGEHERAIHPWAAQGFSLARLCAQGNHGRR